METHGFGLICCAKRPFVSFLPQWNHKGAVLAGARLAERLSLGLVQSDLSGAWSMNQASPGL